MVYLLLILETVSLIIAINFWSITPGSTLGKTGRQIDEEINLKKRHLKIKEEINLWQERIETHPGFRDAYLKLAVLNWQIDENAETKKYLDKVLEIDPNNSSARELERLSKSVDD